MRLIQLNSFLLALRDINRDDVDLSANELAFEEKQLERIWPSVYNAPSEGVVALSDQLKIAFEKLSQQVGEKLKSKDVTELTQSPSMLQDVIDIINKASDEVIELTEKQGLLIREIWAKTKESSSNSVSETDFMQYVLARITSFNELNIKIVMVQEFQDSAVRKLKSVHDLIKKVNQINADLKEALCGIVSDKSDDFKDDLDRQKKKAPEIIGQSEIDDLLKSFNM